MADSFGLKIGLEGEKEFKKALADINQSFKVLGSEMKLATSQFDKNDKSVEALAARNKVLRKEIDEQTTKIDTLRKALQNAATSFGENDRRTQNWQIQLNNAEAALNDMNRELDENEKAIKEGGKAAEESGSKFEGFGKVLKTVGVALGAVAVAAGAAAKRSSPPMQTTSSWSAVWIPCSRTPRRRSSGMPPTHTKRQDFLPTSTWRRSRAFPQA